MRLPIIQVKMFSGDYLEEFIHLCKKKESTDQLLGKSILEDSNEGTADSYSIKTLISLEIMFCSYSQLPITLGFCG